jgi:hypothetical protein
MDVSYLWRGEFSNDAVNQLHARGVSGLSTSGIAAQMLAVCVTEARKARCEWLHVDFGDELRPLYFDSAGFMPTNAGLIML